MSREQKLLVLSRIAEKLNAESITWGVGASLLLYFKGITDDFHDIDMMTTAEDVEKVKSALESMGTLQPPNPADQYHTHHFYEFVIDGVDVDAMEGFVIVKDGKEYDCSFTADSIVEHVEIHGQDIPLQSVADWRRYYDLMGRTAKVEMIDKTEEHTMNDREIIEGIIRNIAASFTGAQSTRDWTDETIWFDASPYACVGKERASKVFDAAFGALKSCNVSILKMKTRINGDSALVCSVQKWDTVNADGSENPPFMMRQTNYLEKQNGEWKVLHEHTSMAAGWDGTIDE